MMTATQIITVSILGLAGFVLSLMFGLPLYSVWQQGLSGEAALHKARQTRQIIIEQARAEKESATFRAEAIRIVGESAQAYPEYRKQEFMGAFAEALQEGNIRQIIYVPTEANLPILEAGKR
jgi:regulator of protease activity HflC (stomatin/prohibitin superfamily)